MHLRKEVFSAWKTPKSEGKISAEKRRFSAKGDIPPYIIIVTYIGDFFNGF
jgi:hypothetical protein